MSLRRVIAIIVGKTAIFFSRFLGNQGTAFPGKLARRIYPSILPDLAGRINNAIIIVTGTNGKTTTSNMIAAILREGNNTYVHNQAGANMLTGITTAFIEATNLSGRRRFDYALLETDEANVPLLLREVEATVLLVTNFFRDQLDRFGELDYTANLIKSALSNCDLELLLNADDPLQSDFELCTGLKCWYYSFSDTIYDELSGDNDKRERRYCVFCGHELSYERYHYDQLGQYYCHNCSCRNPSADYIGHGLQMDTRIQFDVNHLDIVSPYQGFYNAYNILAAVAMGKHLNIDDDVIQRAIHNYQPHAGRMEKFIIAGKPCLLVLIKNPTGLNQSLNMLTLDQAPKNLFFALNDNAGDGRDISWIWDAELETVTRPEARIEKIICSGLRSGDIALRIKYAGYPVEYIEIETRLREGIAQTIASASETAIILSTYTALFTCRQILLQMQKKSTATVPPPSQSEYQSTQKDKDTA